MKDVFARISRVVQSNPRRWFWVLMLLVTLLVLWLTGNLR